MLLHEDVLEHHPPGLAVGEHMPLGVLGYTHRPVTGAPVREEAGQSGLYLVNLPVLVPCGVRIEQPYCPEFRQSELYSSSLNGTSPPMHIILPRSILRGPQPENLRYCHAHGNIWILGDLVEWDAHPCITPLPFDKRPRSAPLPISREGVTAPSEQTYTLTIFHRLFLLIFFYKGY